MKPVIHTCLHAEETLTNATVIPVMPEGSCKLTQYLLEGE
jgi:hypothetical protein